MSKKKKKSGCYHCGETDHRAKDCPSTVCTLCGTQGHAIGSCPSKPPPPVDRGHFSTAPETSAFAFVELFAGMGGFRVALQKLGGHCVFASEVDRFCVQNYQLNFEGNRPAGDVTRIEADWIPEHDLLVGGFPCQPFSSSGRREGLEDATRGNLFREIVRILKAKQPKAFLLENVRGLLLHNDGKTLQVIAKELEGCGYNVSWKLVDAVHILPQERCRLFLVGIQKDLIGKDDNNPPFLFPELPNWNRGVQDILQGVTPEDPLPNQEKLELTPHQIAKVQSQPYTQLHPEARFLSDLSKPSKTLQASYTSYMVGSQFVPSGEGGGWRRFSPREAARLQGFPESFKLCPQRPYHMLGNAVAPPIIALLAAPLLQAIGSCGDGDGRAVAKEMLLEAAPPDSRRGRLEERMVGFGTWLICSQNWEGPKELEKSSLSPAS